MVYLSNFIVIIRDKEASSKEPKKDSFLTKYTSLVETVLEREEPVESQDEDYESNEKVGMGVGAGVEAEDEEEGGEEREKGGSEGKGGNEGSKDEFEAKEIDDSSEDEGGPLLKPKDLDILLPRAKWVKLIINWARLEE